MPQKYDVLVNNKAYTNYNVIQRENDFIIKLNEIDISHPIVIKCVGENMEIEAAHLLNEDIDSIINDLKIKTTIKEKLAKIAFSDMPINQKRIAIRRLGRQGLQFKFVQMFLKLYDYLQEV